MIGYIILVILVLVMLYSRKPKLLPVNIEGSHRKWNVVGKYENHEDAAKLLGQCHHNILIFMRNLRKKYHIDETDDVIAQEGPLHKYTIGAGGDTHNVVSALLDNYNPDVIYENDPAYGNDTSYTVNKGEKLCLCLRSKSDPSKLVDYNTLMFTILHEISHIANYAGWGHKTDFWTIMKFILHEAVLVGIYKPVDYGKYPVNFCGLDITYQPLYDKSLRNLWQL